MKNHDFSVNIEVTLTLTNPVQAKQNGKLTDTARIAGSFSADGKKAPVPIKWEGATFVGEDGKGNGGSFGTAIVNALAGDKFDATTGGKADNEAKIQSIRGTLSFTWDPKKQSKGDSIDFGNQFPKSISVEVAP